MTQQHPAHPLSRRMSRVTVTFFGRDICRDIRRESRHPDPTRPDPTRPLKDCGATSRLNRLVATARDADDLSIGGRSQ